MNTRRDKGSGSIYQNAQGYWVGTVELPSHGGSRRRKVVTRKKKTDLVAAMRDARKELDRAGDLPTAAPTVASWMQHYLDDVAAKRLKPRTLETYRGYSDRYIVPAIGRARIDRLTPAHVAKVHDYVIGLGLSSTTALQAHAVLRSALKQSVREGKAGKNVASRDYVDAPRKAVTTRAALSVPEAHKLLVSVAQDPLLAASWSVALMAGMRQGERLGITRGAVDLERDVITVEWQVQRLKWQHGCRKRTTGWACGKVRGGSCPDRVVEVPAGQEAKRVHGGLWMTRPKSRAGWREVPIPPQLRDVLALYLEKVEPGDEGLIFHDGDGHPLDPSADSAAWRDSLRAAGLPAVVLHSARHTANTLLHELGVDDETRQKIMGHSSAVVNATYVHVSDALTRDAMRRLGEAYQRGALTAS